MFGRDCNPVYLFRASDIQFEEEYSEDDSLIEHNTIKPKLITALNKGLFLSDLHKLPDEKSNYLPFDDLIAYHSETLFDYNFKEKAVCLVSQWYNEYSATSLSGESRIPPYKIFPA